MTATLAATRALAVDIRQRETGEALGVALLVASERYVAFLPSGAPNITSPTLSAEAWQAIEAWQARRHRQFC